MFNLLATARVVVSICALLATLVFCAASSLDTQVQPFLVAHCHDWRGGRGRLAINDGCLMPILATHVLWLLVKLGCLYLKWTVRVLKALSI